ncbi:uncharacterized protein BDW70DRAFT_165339 [Aspergillus foveolatus]|uniref:uncharacterized protein n=1 Tax=Aspergillus foveolatus TaxID=210207 RepID=UPI003CCDB924
MALLSPSQASHEPTRPTSFDSSKATVIPMKKHRTRNEGEIVGVSFVSGADLKAAFTSRQTGKFTELGFQGNGPNVHQVDDPEVTLPTPGDLLKSHIRYLSPTSDTAFFEKANLGEGSYFGLWVSSNPADHPVAASQHALLALSEVVSITARNQQTMRLLFISLSLTWLSVTDQLDLSYENAFPSSIHSVQDFAHGFHWHIFR